MALPHSKTRNIFCARSCSAAFNNRKRRRSDESKQKVSLALRGRVLSEEHRRNLSLARGGTGVSPRRTRKTERRKGLRKVFRPELHPYPVSALMQCRGCRRLIKTAPRRFCEACGICIRTYRARAAFKFNIYDFPDMFPLSMIEEHGWHSPPGRNGRNSNRNLNGVSRDHLYSVFDGFINQVNPDLLSHPANCGLVLHSENNRKKAKSSITLDELMTRIERWEETRPRIAPCVTASQAPATAVARMSSRSQGISRRS